MARPFNPYKDLQTEPDLRSEFFNTMDGRFPEIAKGQQLVFRKMRVDNSGNLIQCECVDVLTKEADKDTFCSICFGEGYIWDEVLVDGYKQVIRSSVGLSTKENLHGPGLTNLSYVSFYFKYNLPINVFPKKVSPDKVVEMITDVDGNPVRPYTRKAIYRIGTAIAFRSDNAKVEYYKLDCYEEQIKFLNGPQG